MSENKFCYLKGMVDCSSGIIQDCNLKRVQKCMLEEQNGSAILSQDSNLSDNIGEKGPVTPKESVKEAEQNTENYGGFCFLKGLVTCSPGRIQDCNMKHVNTCMLETNKQ